MYIPKPEKWFIERIGKRIYRDILKECCIHCSDVAENGLVVHDLSHARYLAMVDSEFGCEGVFSNYRDEK